MAYPLEVVRLGRIRYAAAMELMEARVTARMADEVPDTLYLLEHEPVLTLGRRAQPENILVSPERLAQLGVELYDAGRGGDVTYHGPGQIVGYPVLKLSPNRKDVRKYVANLEEVMIRVCASYGVAAGRTEGLIGCWIEQSRKIGAIGVRISRWVTSHGFALNVASALDAFSLIVPCGITDKAVTSLSQEVGRTVTVEAVLDQVEDCFHQVFDAERRV